ncbi:MAG: O-acetyl-ADP-ribose deacetylase [Magnetococcales bacterium]|nr:O-acetyl-ADP-ribose deacetylase [Magnetococcales bacterium]NGZ26329.1 O-acetyl-ADP-ribose deacetylase [Magnetococcales bacterium]
MSTSIQVITGDITRLTVDAIVNAANSSLLGGGGVDGAIHRAGGPAILDACQRLRKEKYPQGLPTGQAVMTTGGQLAARYVIHTVGPIYDRDPNPAANLAACYRNCLQVARQNGVTSIAFPGISTGIYGYPKEEAASIAVDTIQGFLQEFPSAMERVLLVAFSPDDATILQQALVSRQGTFP